jgi:hypothetical protein
LPPTLGPHVLPTHQVLLPERSLGGSSSNDRFK